MRQLSPALVCPCCRARGLARRAPLRGAQAQTTWRRCACKSTPTAACGVCTSPTACTPRRSCPRSSSSSCRCTSDAPPRRAGAAWAHGAACAMGSAGGGGAAALPSTPPPPWLACSEPMSPEPDATAQNMHNQPRRCVTCLADVSSARCRNGVNLCMQIHEGSTHLSLSGATRFDQRHQ